MHELNGEMVFTRDDADDLSLTLKRVEDIEKKVDEIHEFCQNLANALKGLEQNPMLRTMLGL